AESFGKLGADARATTAIELAAALKEAVPAIRALLKDGEKDVRFMAVFALGRVDPEPPTEVVDDLAARMLKDAAPDVQKAAAGSGCGGGGGPRGGPRGPGARRGGRRGRGGSCGGGRCGPSGGWGPTPGRRCRSSRPPSRTRTTRSAPTRSPRSGPSATTPAA